MAFTIDQASCVGCGACAFICLFDAPSAANADASLYAIDEKKCVECGQCTAICPVGAIRKPDGYKKIVRVEIEPENCNGCSRCARLCKAKAPQGELLKPPFVIDQSKCFRCGVCASHCARHAIRVDYAD